MDFTAHSGLDTGFSYATLDISHSGKKWHFLGLDFTYNLWKEAEHFCVRLTGY